MRINLNFIDPKLVNTYLNSTIKSIIILLSGLLIIWIISRFIKKLVKITPRFKLNVRKAETLSSVMISAVKYTIYIVMVASILSVFNVLTQPVIAAAGLGGIAIGFGAQSLIRDFFAGFFILFEDQFGVGDYISVTTALTGTVEEMSLRVTRLRALTGELHIIPNGEIKTVTNHSRGNSLAIVEIPISYNADREKAMAILVDISGTYYEANRELLEEKPEMLGVSRYGENELAIRVIAKTKSMVHWQVERELRAAFIDGIKEAGIEPPIQRRIIYNS